MSPMLTTPVALILFNRPETTARVFAEIARARPAKLLLVADGPRVDKPGEAEKCAAARAVVEQVDWDCEVLRNYSETNLGCKMRPVTGINWVFDNVEEAIILEDDCLPHLTFFRFCEELLERYRDDERVMMIGGTNFLGEWKSDLQSYYFSYFGGSWGWASWQRAWRYFDPGMTLWPEILETRFLDNLFSNPRHSSYWKTIFHQVYDGTITSAWDYQWLLACWIQNGFRILPEVNLISNIGFGDDASHTFGESPLANMPTKAISFPLRHPPFMVRSVEADILIQERFYTPPPSSIINRLKAHVSRVAHRLERESARVV